MRQIKISSTITNRSSVTEKFFTDIKKYKPLSHEEEVEQCIIIKTGTPEQVEKAREKLVLHNMRFVVSVAKQCMPAAMHSDDYIAFGYEGLIKATYDYDHTKGFKFITYAVWWIRQSIMDKAGVVKDTIRVPHNIRLMGMRIKGYREKFMNENGCEPSIFEIAEHFKISLDNAINALNAFGMVTNDAQTVDTGEEDGASRSEEFMDNESHGETFAAASNEDVKHIIRHLLSMLNDKHRRIITLAYDLDGNFDGRYSLARVAEYSGTTKEMARVTVAKIIKILRNRIHSKSGSWMKETLAD